MSVEQAPWTRATVQGQEHVHGAQLAAVGLDVQFWTLPQTVIFLTPKAALACRLLHDWHGAQDRLCHG